MRKIVVIEGLFAQDIEREAKKQKGSLLLFPEILNNQPICNTAIMERILEFISKNQEAVIATMSEVAVLVFQNMVRNKYIKANEVVFYNADENGVQLNEHSTDGGFIFYRQTTSEWEAGFYLRFDDPLADLKNFPSFQETQNANAM